MIPQIVYILCGLTSILCAVLLQRRYRTHPAPLLFWSVWCFVCLSVNNILLFADLVVFPQIDLSIARSLTALAGMLMLIWGMILRQK
ncbi:MAG TPA: DUF5985 family protein [Verrucomicrobiae bacterium]|jgi:hypothetical protein